MDKKIKVEEKVYHPVKYIFNSETLVKIFKEKN
jgi:hypothetical protein